MSTVYFLPSYRDSKALQRLRPDLSYREVPVDLGFCTLVVRARDEESAKRIAARVRLRLRIAQL